MARFITDSIGITTPKAVKDAQRQASEDLVNARAKEAYARQGLAAQRKLFGGGRTRRKLRRNKDDNSSVSNIKDTLGSA